MAVLSKDNWLRNETIKTIKFSNGDHAYIRKLPAAFIVNKKDGAGIQEQGFFAVIQSLCDERGEALFSEEDRETVLGMPLEDYQTLVSAVTEFNNLGETSEKN